MTAYLCHVADKNKDAKEPAIKREERFQSAKAPASQQRFQKVRGPCNALKNSVATVLSLVYMSSKCCQSYVLLPAMLMWMNSRCFSRALLPGLLFSPAATIVAAHGCQTRAGAGRLR
jgi:hypothetical protein